MRGRTRFNPNSRLAGMTARSFASRLGRGRAASPRQRAGARAMM